MLPSLKATSGRSSYCQLPGPLILDLLTADQSWCAHCKCLQLPVLQSFCISSVIFPAAGKMVLSAEHYVQSGLICVAYFLPLRTVNSHCLLFVPAFCYMQKSWLGNSVWATKYIFMSTYRYICLYPCMYIYVYVYICSLSIHVIFHYAGKISLQFIANYICMASAYFRHNCLSSLIFWCSKQ